MGGGTVGLSSMDIWKVGLSPRGRGNHRAAMEGPDRGRSIPAWAGEPRSRLSLCLGLWVYPRVGGGTLLTRRTPRTIQGLSPRGRGNRAYNGDGLGDFGSIPAWAGEPHYPQPAPGTGRVYPRVGGGTINQARLESRSRGLSPRGRGNLNVPLSDKGNGRSIPAWAGEPCVVDRSAWHLWVYPRVGGGTPGVDMLQELLDGLSPRGRGNQIQAQVPSSRERSIPAWAGEPRSCHRLRGTFPVYPRVGGGTSGSQDGKAGG